MIIQEINSIVDIKEIRLNSVGQFDFFHNIESFVIAVNKEIDKK